MKRIQAGSYLNFDLILEIGVVEFYAEGKVFYIIKYWDITENEEQIPGVWDTKEEAQKVLDKIMGCSGNY